MKFIFATHNDNKVREVLSILQSDTYNIEVNSLKSIGYTDEIEETGTTLVENAWIKADQLYQLLGGNIMAEDTGLEVTALGMTPGVYSARYAGEHKSDRDNINKLLTKLGSHSDRSAQFRTVLAVWLDGLKYTFEGIVRGTIAPSEMGDGGFGYDPIFIPDGFTDSFGILSPEIKNSISHRAKAFINFRDFLLEYC